MNKLLTVFAKITVLIRANFYTGKQYYLTNLASYKIKNYLGFCRGLFAILQGKIDYSEAYFPLIIGNKTILNIEPKARIVLTSDPDNLGLIDTNSINNPVSPQSSSIGLSSYFYFLAPPCYNYTKIELSPKAQLILSQNTFLSPGMYITVGRNVKLSIGKNTYISHNVKINCKNGISIGNNCLIGFATIIMDYDGHRIGNLTATTNNASKPINIGNSVWIGMNATILKGVNIGNNSIIAANSVITKNVPENCIAAGNPAKIIKQDIYWVR